MTTWTKDELRSIGGTDDLHVAPFREDGETYGTPTWIWSVVVDDALYVRAYSGRHSCWYRAAVKQKAGRITAAGMTKKVDPSAISPHRLVLTRIARGIGIAFAALLDSGIDGQEGRRRRARAFPLCAGGWRWPRTSRTS